MNYIEEMRRKEQRRNSNKAGCHTMLFMLGLACALIVFVNLYGHFIGFEKEPEHLTSNDTIIIKLRKDFHDEYSFYTRAADILYKVPYEGDISYTFPGTPNYQNKLKGPHGCLNDTFPEVISEMLKISGGRPHRRYSLKRKNGIIYFPQSVFLTNMNHHSPYMIYTERLEQEVRNCQDGYLICDTVSNDYTGGWLLRLEKNWYIVSPDSIGFRKHTSNYFLPIP